MHLTFSLVHIIYHIFYYFKVSDCRRKLYTLMGYQPAYVKISGNIN